jgi:hypothetical protein
MCFSLQVTVLSGRKKQPAYFSESAEVLKKSGNSAPKNGDTFPQARGFIGFLKVW